MNESIIRISNQQVIPERVDKNELHKVCQDFESIFIHQMLKAMRKTIPKTGFFGKSSGKELFESFFDIEVGKLISKKGGFGIGKMLYENLIRKVENQKGTPVENIEGNK